MSHKLKATAIYHPAAYQFRQRNPFDLPGVALTHRNFVPDERDAVLLFGGDGTVHMYLQQVAAVGAPLLVVPTGSGNDFARALGLRTVADALAAWKRFCVGGHNVRSIDLGVITNLSGSPSSGKQQKPPSKHPGLPDGQTYFCCVGGAGLDAEANRRGNAMRPWLRGHGGYTLAALQAVFAFPPTRISVDGPRPLSEPALFVAFANAPAYGGGMRIAPAARLDDGLLDICYVRKTGKLRLLRFFPTVFSGNHVTMKEVEYFPAERLRVEAERPLEVYADGEYVCRTPVEVSVARGALRVIVP